MKCQLLATILLGLIPSANAIETCNFVSEYYPDVTIEIDNDKRKFGGLTISIKNSSEGFLTSAKSFNENISR